MAKQTRSMEGNAEQRRAAAREAKREGKRPSEVGATLGASKQRKKAPGNASHQERLELKHEGKANPPSADQPRPGNRGRDPKRDGSKWG